MKNVKWASEPPPPGKIRVNWYSGLFIKKKRKMFVVYRYTCMNGILLESLLTGPGGKLPDWTHWKVYSNHACKYRLPNFVSSISLWNEIKFQPHGREKKMFLLPVSKNVLFDLYICYHSCFNHLQTSMVAPLWITFSVLPFQNWMYCLCELGELDGSCTTNISNKYTGTSWKYSVKQSDGNSFCGDVVLESFEMV